MKSPTVSASEREQSFQMLYEDHADRVMAWCLRHAGPQLAEDVVAETFLVAWRKFDQIGEPPIAWLLVTARNALHEQSRKQRRQGEIAGRLAPLGELASPSPEMGVQRRDEILQALGQLNEDDREALLLIAWDGLTTDEAAEVLGIRPGTLRVRIHRARTALRRSTTSAASSTTTGVRHA